jgi:hypothetical protein
MEKKLHTPSLTERSLDEAKKILGKEFKIEQWNEETSKDVIRHYMGCGDDNPLYCDSVCQEDEVRRIIAPASSIQSLMRSLLLVCPTSSGSILARTGPSSNRSFRMIG